MIKTLRILMYIYWDDYGMNEFPIVQCSEQNWFYGAILYDFNVIYILYILIFRFCRMRLEM